MDSDEKSVFCTMCGRRIDANRGHYIVRIEVFAAAEPPDKLIYLDETKDFKEEVDRLLDKIASTDPRELQDQVYKFFKFDLCRLCQNEYIKNPLGKRV